VVTGIVVNEKVNLSRKYYRDLRALLHDWDKNGIEVAVANHYNIQGIPDKRLINGFYHSVLGKIKYLEYVRGLRDPLAQKLIGRLNRIKYYWHGYN